HFADLADVQVDGGLTLRGRTPEYLLSGQVQIVSKRARGWNAGEYRGAADDPSAGPHGHRTGRADPEAEDVGCAVEGRTHPCSDGRARDPLHACRRARAEG